MRRHLEQDGIAKSWVYTYLQYFLLLPVLDTKLDGLLTQPSTAILVLLWQTELVRMTETELKIEWFLHPSF